MPIAPSESEGSVAQGAILLPCGCLSAPCIVRETHLNTAATARDHANASPSPFPSVHRSLGLLLLFTYDRYLAIPPRSRYQPLLPTTTRPTPTMKAAFVIAAAGAAVAQNFGAEPSCAVRFSLSTISFPRLANITPGGRFLASLRPSRLPAARSQTRAASAARAWRPSRPRSRRAC